MGIAVPDDEFTTQIETEAAALKQQLNTKFPQAMSLLTQYGHMYQRAQVQSPQAGWTMVNLYVIANAAAYVNAAVATMLAVAAAVAAVVAAVTILE
jgi:hypothetical protein